jgi:CelD/BcsL family acetyltransferase involved in cellulose biosynthesis
VEADVDTDVKGGDDARTDPDAGGVAKPRWRTRSAVGKQLASAVSVAVSTVKAVEKKKKRKRKRKVSSSLAVVTPMILTPRSREVESEEEEEEKDEAVEELLDTEDQPMRRSESPAATR